MKNNKLFKIMIGLVSAIVVVGVVYFGVSYFNGEDNQKKTNNQVTEKNESKNEDKKDDNNSTNQESQGNQQQSGSQSKQSSNNNAKNVITSPSHGSSSSNASSGVIKSQEYGGKKISGNEGLGTTGKVFKSQKEAMEFGNSEVARLAKEDRKSRQFSVSKVAADDGSVLGWTVDIYLDNSTSTNSNDKNESN